MKKVLVIGLLICLLTGMTGCDKEEVVRIEDYDWNLTFVLSSEDGRVLGCAPEHYEAHKDDETIQVMNIDCIVSDTLVYSLLYLVLASHYLCYRHRILGYGF